MKIDNNSREHIATHCQIKYLTVEGAANLLGLKLSRVRNMVFKKQIPYLKVGASIRFDKEQLQNWIKTKVVQVG